MITVEPAFGGQSFMHDPVEKVSRLKAERESKKLDYVIQIDGGVNRETVKELGDADCLVAGSFVFGASDRAQALRDLS